ncbi:MAG: ATP-binding protein [Streptosporangiales bacterium]|nr:ATP-binding protein [Streptosporangiales bacterium]
MSGAAARDWPLTSAIPEMGAYVHAPATVRWQVRETLRAWEIPGVSDSAELVASELVSNSVAALADPDTVDAEHPAGLPRMAGDSVATIAVRLRSDGHLLLIEVWDPADGKPERRDAGPDDESGRGLVIVEALSERFGCDPHEAGGKVTWCLLRAGAGPVP